MRGLLLIFLMKYSSEKIRVSQWVKVLHKNRKVFGSNPTGCLARLTDPASF